MRSPKHDRDTKFLLDIELASILYHVSLTEIPSLNDYKGISKLLRVEQISLV